MGSKRSLSDVDSESAASNEDDSDDGINFEGNYSWKIYLLV